MTLKNTFLIAGLSISLAATAYAQSDVLPSANATFEGWGEESGWNILIDKSRNTCFIEAIDSNETVVQMGLTADHKLGYLGVFSKTLEIEEESTPS